MRPVRPHRWQMKGERERKREKGGGGGGTRPLTRAGRTPPPPSPRVPPPPLSPLHAISSRQIRKHSLPPSASRRRHGRSDVRAASPSEWRGLTGVHDEMWGRRERGGHRTWHSTLPSLYSTLLPSLFLSSYPHPTLPSRCPRSAPTPSPFAPNDNPQPHLSLSLSLSRS